jgi:hypothetical protein
VSGREGPAEFFRFFPPPGSGCAPLCVNVARALRLALTCATGSRTLRVLQQDNFGSPLSPSRRSYNQLTGTLAPELGRSWASLEDFEAANNAFTGPLPPEWAGMASLKTLYLQ